MVSNIWNGKISIHNGAIFEKSPIMTPLSYNYLEKMVSLWKKRPQVTFWDNIFFTSFGYLCSLLSTYVFWLSYGIYDRMDCIIAYYSNQYINICSQNSDNPMTDFEVFDSRLYARVT